MRLSPWICSLPDYLGPCFVELQETAFDAEMILRAKCQVFGAERDEFVETRHPWRGDLRFLKRTRRPGDIIGAILVEDARTGERLGGTISGLPYVREDARQSGIGAEIICFSDMNDAFALRPVRYSISGFQTRKAAHRRHVARALSIDRSLVTEDAMEWYSLMEDGELQLSRLWTPVEQNDLAAAYRRRTKRQNRYPHNGYSG